MDIQRAAELLAARSTKDFGNALKDRGDPFKDFYKSLPICILDAVFSIGVRYTSVVNVVNSYMATFDLTISRTQTDETEHMLQLRIARQASGQFHVVHIESPSFHAWANFVIRYSSPQGSFFWARPHRNKATPIFNDCQVVIGPVPFASLRTNDFP